MKSLSHRLTTITQFYRYRYLTPGELASVSSMSVAIARKTLNDLRDRGYLVKDGKRYRLKSEPLFYTPFYDSPSTEIAQEEI